MLFTALPRSIAHSAPPPLRRLLLPTSNCLSRGFSMSSSFSGALAKKKRSPFAVPELDESVNGPPTIDAADASTSTSTTSPSPGTTYVLFHSPCPDGAFAALAAWLHFSEGGGAKSSTKSGEIDGVRFVPHRVFESLQVPTPTAAAAVSTTSAVSATATGPLSSLSRRDTVYLLDYSGPSGFPQELARVARRVVVLDHHKTAAEQLSGVVAAAAWKKEKKKEKEAPVEDNKEDDGSTEEKEEEEEEEEDLGNLEVLIDQDRSGATIAAAHFAPELTDAQGKAFAAIEDGDLWRWRLPSSKAFYAGLHSSGAIAPLLLSTADAGAAAAGGGGGEKGAKKEEEEEEEVASVATSPEEMLLRLSKLDFDDIVAQGEKVVEERDREVAEIAAGAFEVELRGPEGPEAPGAKTTTPSSSSPSSAAAAAPAGAAAPSSFGRALAIEVKPEQAGLRSQLGNVLAAMAKERGEKEEREQGGRKKMRAVGVVAYREHGMIIDEDDDSLLLPIKVSLRSIGEGEDTTPVSQAHGGGGHRNASSFLMPAAEFRRWRV